MAEYVVNSRKIGNNHVSKLMFSEKKVGDLRLRVVDVSFNDQAFDF
jgi:hypothetical protein